MSPDIKELFEAAADDSRRDQLDARALLARGKRKLRARNAGVAVGGGVAAVAVLLMVSQLPRELADGPVPPAQTPTQPATPRPTSSAASSTPVTTSRPSSPGTATAGTRPPQSAAQTSGAEVIRKLSLATAEQRCAARMQAEYGAAGTPVPDPSQQAGVYVTDLLKIRLPGGQTRYCSVPGPAAPSYGTPPKDVREACGRLAWMNLTSWTSAKQETPDGGFTAALWSNDRTAVLFCDTDDPGATRSGPVAIQGASVRLLRTGTGWVRVHWLGSERAGRQYWGGGGVVRNDAVRYAMFAGARKLTESKAFYGVYALRSWLPAGVTKPDRVVGYGADGSVVDSYPVP
ncbi:MAG TPA: hypothetical protein VGJ44_24800 [Kribbellaceae bacterium]